MSEDRMERIERSLAALAGEVRGIRADIATKKDLAGEVAAIRAEMATKEEVAAIRAEMATKEEVAAIRAEMATKEEVAAIRAEMATKDDVAGVAKNVDVPAIGRQLRELLIMKDDVAVLTAIVQRLDHMMTRQMSDLLTEVRAEHSRMDRLLDRVCALEEAQP
jgi:hypothetical protein